MTESTLAFLTLEGPDRERERIPLTKSRFRIGRLEDNDLVLAHNRVSRHHAAIHHQEGAFQIVDLNSSNGTWLGDDRLDPEKPASLPLGKPVQIGPYTMALSAPPEPEPQAPPPPKEAAEKEAPGPSKEPAAKEPKEAKEPEKGDEKPKARPKKEEKREQDRARKTAEPEAKLSAAPPPQAPPPAGPPGPPLSENGRERYDAFFGLPKDESRYVRFLPPLYSGLPFLGSFLLAFEAVLTPIEQIVDHFDLYLDPGTSPERFLDQLARWLGLTLDEKWPPEKRRAVLKESAELYRRRGTRWGLSRHIEIYAGVPPKITEPKNRPHHFKVSIKLPKSARVEEETLRRIVAANKPAHATYELEVKRGS